jgi:hypothetical protein
VSTEVMTTRRLLAIVARVALSILLAGVFYTAWMAVAIPTIKAGFGGWIVKAVLWFLAPIVTGFGFALGPKAFELLSPAARKSSLRKAYKWCLAGCAIGGGVLWLFGPMLIAFGMFAAGTLVAAVHALISSTTVRRNDLNAAIFTLFACASLVMSYGCSQPEAPGPSPKNTGLADVCDSKLVELPVHYETQAETLARIMAEPEAAKSQAKGAVHKEWYGRTLLGLGGFRQIIVPHVPTGGDGEFRQVTTLQIQKALTEYVLVDCADLHSSAHIPMGTHVKIEYEDGMIGWINIYAGTPRSVSLEKDGSTAEYGLRKTSEQNAPPRAASPAR